MTATPPLFILNEGGSIGVVHAVECPTVQHQVRQDFKEEQAGFKYEYLGKSPDGASLIIERRGEPNGHYSAKYVTAKDLLTHSRKYRRCRTCAPDVPESPRQRPKDRRSIRGKSIKPDHLGKYFEGIGILSEVHLTHDGYRLIGADTTKVIGYNETVEYLIDFPSA